MPGCLNTPEQISDYQAARQAPPASDDWIKLRVKANAGLFFMSEKAAEAEPMTIHLWPQALEKIPGPFVALAFKEWESTKTHRPAPAHIAAIAKAKMAEMDRELKVEQRLADRGLGLVGQIEGKSEEETNPYGPDGCEDYITAERAEEIMREFGDSDIAKSMIEGMRRMEREEAKQ